MKALRAQLDAGENPRNVKMRLAREIVTIYHGDQSARAAEEEFVRVFREKGKPDEMREIMYPLSKPGDTVPLIDVIFSNGIVDSRSKVKTLIKEGAVKLNDTRIDTLEPLDLPEGEYVLQVGKREFRKLCVFKPIPPVK
jgi:tyrosyl-tRNA synthetase